MPVATNTKLGASANSPFILAQAGIPFILPSSGTIGNNGALSAITALPTTYSSGCYMYFPANAIAAGVAAGRYYVVMSSTTAGTIYNNTYAGGIPEIPASPTAFVTTGPGAYTQTTGAPIELTNSVLPGGALGKNGAMFIYPVWAYSNSANTKTITVNLGGTALAQWTPTTTSNATYAIRAVNRGAQTLQVSVPSATFGAGTTAFSYLSINTAIDNTINRTAQLAVASDFVILEAYCVQVMPGN